MTIGLQNVGQPGRRFRNGAREAFLAEKITSQRAEYTTLAANDGERQPVPTKSPSVEDMPAIDLRSPEAGGTELVLTIASSMRSRNSLGTTR